MIFVSTYGATYEERYEPVWRKIFLFYQRKKHKKRLAHF
ncbi:MAG: hypothetical protein BSOLF_0860 [Candidatus Carbobacillus altaicus]|uniref:Uncharacterized protein n=1 Tax=Candidatus Carbonibacillus altaicus TaxID=2163959 RepID=A0A2R6XX93_9BACL|nr:MAG: hypothetical protein BSOLF_0860 [Candidatus Carbobacillus altaicus]